MLRIRISGEFGGMIIVAMVGFFITAAIAGFFNILKEKVFGGNEAAKKVLSIIVIIVWLAGLSLVALDLLDIYPLFRHILYTFIK